MTRDLCVMMTLSSHLNEMNGSTHEITTVSQHLISKRFRVSNSQTHNFHKTSTRISLFTNNPLGAAS